MNFDWVVSLFVVTFIVFGLIVVEEVEFATFEHAYSDRAQTASVASLIADKVARAEGIAANTTEVFVFGSNSPGAITLPGNLNGHPYSVAFTHDYVIVETNGSSGSGTPVGTAVNFWEPVYLFDKADLNQLMTNGSLAGQGSLNGSALQQWSDQPVGTCEAFPSGTNLLLTHVDLRVDGHPEYLTVVSSVNGYHYPC